MNPNIADRIRETSVSTGVGAFALAGAVRGYRAFADACAVGDVVCYTIEAVDTYGSPTGEWEVGVGVYSAASTLTRSRVLASSNAGSAVNFTANKKFVWLDVPAAQIAYVSRRNLLDNGAPQVWQRGTTFASGAAQFTADRWAFVRAGAVGGATLSRQAGSQSQYCMRIQRDVGNASAVALNVAQSVESANSIPYRSRPVTLAFRARCGANFSAAGSLLSYLFASGTGTDESIISGFTGGANIAVGTVALSQAWQTFVIPSATPGAAITQLGLQFFWTPSAVAAGAADYVEIEEIQLAPGDYVGTFPYCSYDDELARCRRFLPAFAGAVSTFANGLARTAAQAYIPIPFGVQPRVAPTGVTVSNGAHFALTDGVTNTVSTTVVFAAATLYAGTLDVGVAAGLTQFRPYLLIFNNGAASILFTGAEI